MVYAAWYLDKSIYSAILHANGRISFMQLAKSIFLKGDPSSFRLGLPVAISVGSNSTWHALARLKAVMAPAHTDDRFISSSLWGMTNSLSSTSLMSVGGCLLWEIAAIVR